MVVRVKYDAIGMARISRRIRKLSHANFSIVYAFVLKTADKKFVRGAILGFSIGYWGFVRLPNG